MGPIDLLPAWALQYKKLVTHHSTPTHLGNDLGYYHQPGIFQSNPFSCTVGSMARTNQGNRAKPLQQMLRDLGIVQTFSRPRTPNDNPFIEALFATVKTAPAYPGWFPSASIQPALDYFKSYFQWYNYEHYHSGIEYVHPLDKYEMRAEAILEERKQRLISQRNQRRLYWSKQNQYQLTGNG